MDFENIEKIILELDTIKKNNAMIGHLRDERVRYERPTIGYGSWVLHLKREGAEERLIAFLEEESRIAEARIKWLVAEQYKTLEGLPEEEKEETE